MVYSPDTFTEADVLACLEMEGLRYRNGSRYILSQCPLHEDKNASVQIYKDDWFVKCHAGCEGGRFHITKAFPQLRARDGRSSAEGAQGQARRPRPSAKATQVKYKDCSAEIWEKAKWLPHIPSDHYFKNIPISVLDGLGWRWDAEHNRYFIPYFSRSQKSIPFAQWRNLAGNVRFNFWKDTKPTMYGTWNLEPGESIFLVEGCSDAAVMEHCMIPWIAAPSAASGELVRSMAAWCIENNVNVIYAGDNDEAGDKLKDALGDVMSFRRRQPRNPYKDWGEMFEAEGEKSVINWCHAELYPGEPLPFPEIEPGYQAPKEIEPETKSDPPEGWSDMSDVERVQLVFPGSTELRIVGDEKKQLETPPTLPY